MPQMAPLSWVLLFFIFVIMYILNSTKIYFSCSPSMTKTKFNSENIKTNMSWKW